MFDRLFYVCNDTEALVSCKGLVYVTLGSNLKSMIKVVANQ
jgi:hypothetical protein